MEEHTMRNKVILIADGWVYDHDQGSAEVWIKGNLCLLYYPKSDSLGICWSEGD